MFVVSRATHELHVVGVEEVSGLSSEDEDAPFIQRPGTWFAFTRLTSCGAMLPRSLTSFPSSRQTRWKVIRMVVGSEGAGGAHADRLA